VGALGIDCTVFNSGYLKCSLGICLDHRGGIHGNSIDLPRQGWLLLAPLRHIPDCNQEGRWPKQPTVVCKTSAACWI
jgi:hypothetical protein